jgi:hypothetical protein
MPIIVFGGGVVDCEIKSVRKRVKCVLMNSKWVVVDV